MRHVYLLLSNHYYDRLNILAQETAKSRSDVLWDGVRFLKEYSKRKDKGQIMQYRTGGNVESVEYLVERAKKENNVNRMHLRIPPVIESTFDDIINPKKLDRSKVIREGLQALIDYAEKSPLAELEFKKSENAIEKWFILGYSGAIPSQLDLPGL